MLLRVPPSSPKIFDHCSPLTVATSRGPDSSNVPASPAPSSCPKNCDIPGRNISVPGGVDHRPQQRVDGKPGQHHTRLDREQHPPHPVPGAPRLIPQLRQRLLDLGALPGLDRLPAAQIPQHRQREQPEHHRAGHRGHRDPQHGVAHPEQRHDQHLAGLEPGVPLPVALLAQLRHHHRAGPVPPRLHRPGRRVPVAHPQPGQREHHHRAADPEHRQPRQPQRRRVHQPRHPGDHRVAPRGQPQPEHHRRPRHQAADLGRRLAGLSPKCPPTRSDSPL